MNEIIVLPCNGATRVGSTFTRLAAYRARALRPNILLCNSAGLMAGVPEQVELVRRHAVVVIEGCLLNCGEELLREKTLAPAASIKLFDVMAAERVSIAGVQRDDLGENGWKLVEALAQRTVAAVDQLVSEGATAPVPLPIEKQQEQRPRPPARKAPEGLKKVYLFPCVGLLRAEGTVTRNAAFTLVGNLREKVTRLGCAPPAFSAVAPLVDFSNYAVMTLEGCANCCVKKIITVQGYAVDTTVVVEEVLARTGAGVTKHAPDADGTLLQPAVDLVCDYCAGEIDKLLATTSV